MNTGKSNDKQEKLARMVASVRTGGAGSMRRKHKGAGLGNSS